MYSFENDYSEGCSKEILDELAKTNLEQVSGYGLDKYSKEAIKLIKKAIGKTNADIHFVPGGTPCNVLAISLLKPYEAVICAKTGHINVHETGAIENTGHKCLEVDGKDGKVTAQDVLNIINAHSDEHMVKPAMVFISNATEIGTIYSKEEITELSKVCHKYGLYLYMDGARLSNALVAKTNDLSLKDIAKLCDVFYIGGTKNGALLSEAFCIINNNLKNEFRYLLKQKGFMLAKGRTAGISFIKLFENDLYLKNAKHANNMAAKLKNCFKETKARLYSDTYTNQLFVIIDNHLLEKIKKKYIVSYWGKYDEHSSIVRFVTSWASNEEEVDKFIKYYKSIVR